MKKEERLVLKSSLGFTLVELMVAVAITAILLTAAYQVLVGQSRVYETQEQTIDMQQSVRAALDFLSRELRMAGYMVDSSTNVFPPNLINNDASGPDILDGTDSITFVGNTRYGTLIQASPVVGEYTVNVYPALTQNMEFKANDQVNIVAYNPPIVVGTQPTRNKLNLVNLTITTVAYGDPTDPTNTPTMLTLDNDISQPTNFDVSFPLPLAGDYVTIVPQTVSYRVNNDNVLQRSDDNGANWDDLIEEVEDLQFVYAFDSDARGGIDIDAVSSDIIWVVDRDNDGDLDTQVQADGSTVSPIPEPDDWDGTGWDGANVDYSGDTINCPIRAVRVSILIRSARQNPDPRFRDRALANEFALVEDHDRTSLGIQDGFRRRLLQSVVKLRNLGI